MATDAENTAQRKALEEEVAGRVCLDCDSEPQVAWINSEYRLRCVCYPEPPKLVKPAQYVQRRLGEMVNAKIGTDLQRPPRV